MQKRTNSAPSSNKFDGDLFLARSRYGIILTHRKKRVCESCRYFHTDHGIMPSNPPKTALTWSLTTSFGTHCASAFVVALATRLMPRGTYFLHSRYIFLKIDLLIGNSKCFYLTNPIGCLFWCCCRCCHSLLLTFTNYATVIHGIRYFALFQSTIDHFCFSNYRKSFVPIW